MKNVRIFLAILLTVALLGAVAAPARAVTISPLSLTGFNRDMMWGPDGGVGGGWCESISFSPGSDECAFFAAGTLDKYGRLQTHGLPIGNFTSAANPEHVYRLAAAGGDTSSPNGLRIAFSESGEPNSATLTLAAAGKYDKIGILAMATNCNEFGGTYSLRLNYMDGSADATYYAGDWYSGYGDSAVRFYRGQGVAGEGSADGFYVAASLEFNLWETTIDADPNRVLKSITFFGDTYNFEDEFDDYATVVVMAVSGHGEQVPEPSAIVLLVSGLVGLAAYAWRKRR
jgi:hypothetical protein